MVELADHLNQRTGRSFAFQTVAGAYRQLMRDATRGRTLDTADSASEAIASAAPLRRNLVDTGVMGGRDKRPAHIAFPPAEPPTIRLEDVSYTYSDGTAALRG
jgi:hypothetical protein